MHLCPPSPARTQRSTASLVPVLEAIVAEREGLVCCQPIVESLLQIGPMSWAFLST